MATDISSPTGMTENNPTLSKVGSQVTKEKPEDTTTRKDEAKI